MVDGFQHIRFEVEGEIAWLTLNRPATLNAMHLQMRDEIWAALDVFELDESIAVLTFEGAGDRAFSSGADITEFGSSPSLEASRRARIERDLWGRLLACDKVLIASIQCYALGAGLELALCCDIRIAADDAIFGLPETKLGYLPSAGGSQTLPRTIGPGPALDLILAGEPIGADQALRWGLVNYVVAREELRAVSEKLARSFTQQPQQALRLAKRALLDGLDLTLAQGLQLEAHLRAVLLST